MTIQDVGNLRQPQNVFTLCYLIISLIIGFTKSYTYTMHGACIYLSLYIFLLLQNALLFLTVETRREREKKTDLRPLQLRIDLKVFSVYSL